MMWCWVDMVKLWLKLRDDIMSLVLASGAIFSVAMVVVPMAWSSNSTGREQHALLFWVEVNM